MRIVPIVPRRILAATSMGTLRLEEPRRIAYNLVVSVSTAKIRNHVLCEGTGGSLMSTKHEAGSDFLLSESADFLAKNWSTMQRDYGGKWVALAGRSVRLFEDDLAHLHEQIELTCPQETLLVDRIPPPGEDLDWK
jgi:hypothetical protein